MYRDFYKSRIRPPKPLYLQPLRLTPEQLDGFVQGKKATDDEERFAKALDKIGSVQGYEFRMALGAPRGMPGWRELDYLVQTPGGWRAFEIDDTSFVHRGESARNADQTRDLQRIQALERQGIHLARGIEHVDAVMWLDTQAKADARVRELFG